MLPRETQKLAAEIEKKDTQLALLNDNLAERNNHIQAIQHENVALHFMISLHRSSEISESLFVMTLITKSFIDIIKPLLT